MNCLKAQEHFSAYLEDELGYQTIKTFEAHLEECTACRDELALFKKSVNLLNELPPIEPSPFFDIDLQTRLAHIEVDTVPLWQRIVDAIRSQPVWALSGVTTILLMIFAGGFLYPGPFGERSSYTTEVEGRPLPAQPNRLLIEPDIAHVWKSGDIPLAVPDVNWFRPSGTTVADGLGYPSMRQNYILQTANYTKAPTSGGL